MDRNIDMNSFCSFPPPFGGYDAQFEPTPNDINGPFNPIMQYEQAYMYYRYLTMQLEYKMKCKEYDNMQNTKERPRERRE